MTTTFAASQDSSRRAQRGRRSIAALVSGVIAAVALAVAPEVRADAADPDAAYVMTYFRESLDGTANSNNVHLAVSLDGLQWTPLNDNKPILEPLDPDRVSSPPHARTTTRTRHAPRSWPPSRGPGSSACASTTPACAHDPRTRTRHRAHRMHLDDSDRRRGRTRSARVRPRPNRRQAAGSAS